MPDISEIEKRVLAELEEAGEEDVATLLTAVSDVIGNPSDVAAFKVALKRLCDVDMIRMSVSKDPATGRLLDASKDRSFAEIEKISNFLTYSEQRQRWLDNRRVGPPFSTSFPIVVVTADGLTEARALLSQYGYCWWRPQKK